MASIIGTSWPLSAAHCVTPWATMICALASLPGFLPFGLAFLFSFGLGFCLFFCSRLGLRLKLGLR
jgi:hypothetical protein